MVTAGRVAGHPSRSAVSRITEAASVLPERWRDFGAIRAERPGLPTVIENVHGAPLDGARGRGQATPLRKRGVRAPRPQLL